MADDRVTVVFGAEFSDLVSATQQVREQLASVSAVAQESGQQVGTAGEGFERATSGFAAAGSSFKLVETSFTTSLSRVLLGAETWQQAMAHTVAAVAQSFTQQITRMILTLLELAVSLGSNALGGGSLLGGILGGGGQGGILGSLFGGGAESGGAATPGLLSFVGFQAGAWSVPRDMIALVHQGEMILPAGVADMARGGGSGPAFPGAAGAQPAGGSMTLNVSVQALDGASVAQWANANAKALAATIARYMGNNPSTQRE